MACIYSTTNGTSELERVCPSIFKFLPVLRAPGLREIRHGGRVCSRNSEIVQTMLYNRRCSCMEPSSQSTSPPALVVRDTRFQPAADSPDAAEERRLRVKSLALALVHPIPSHPILPYSIGTHITSGPNISISTVHGPGAHIVCALTAARSLARWG